MTSASAITPGTLLLGVYRSIDTIGEGGMGIVVRGEHIGDGSHVAIKFLLPQFAASQEAARRFVREAQAAQRIAGPHVTRVLEAGTSPDFGPYIVMEYLVGSDLSRLIRGGMRPSVEVAIDYIVQAADAIARAHAAGVIHRDIKPANLFLTDAPDGSGLLKVLDFGISKVADDSPLEMTRTTAVLGSGLYMSPEQMRSAKTVDHRSDIYALGITLYELLSGTQPFVAESFPDLCIKVSTEPHDPLRKHRPDLPPTLTAVIERAFARSPMDRYPTAPDFMLALRPFADPVTQSKIDLLQGLIPAPIPIRPSAPPPPPMSTTDPAMSSEPPTHIFPATPAFGRGSDPLGRQSYPAFPRPASLPDIGYGNTHPASMLGLAETSPKSFTATAPPPNSARTLLFAAFGTFLVLCIGGGAYFLFVWKPAEASHVAMTGESTSVALPPSTTTAVAPPDVSVTPSAEPSVGSEASASPSATATSTSTSTSRVLKPKATTSAKASAAPTTQVPTAQSDPFQCFENGLRVECKR